MKVTAAQLAKMQKVPPPDTLRNDIADSPQEKALSTLIPNVFKQFKGPRYQMLNAGPEHIKVRDTEYNVTIEITVK